ncbi:MAG TPA: helix-turn-helix transcriptional regulator [Ensifer sp.]|nr:helix-turn-helix transcriptional regulator [Ensifer sp.]
MTKPATSFEQIKISAFDYESGQTISLHKHRRGQLIHAITGVMEVVVGDRLWRIPPQRAVWIAPDVLHEMRALAPVELRTAYVPPHLIDERFGTETKVISVSPLLRELLLRSVASQPEQEALNAQILALFKAELAFLLQESDSLTSYSVPLPRLGDKRVAKICQALLADPGNRMSLDDWSHEIGASPRTVARLFQSEFGMSFLNWRQQVRVVAALNHLDQGIPVTVVAGELGYETPTAFSNMFRKVTGEVPSDRRARKPLAKRPS